MFSTSNQVNHHSFLFFFIFFIGTPTYNVVNNANITTCNNNNITIILNITGTYNTNTTYN